MADDRMAMVQTPQYYANAREGRIASAAWAQQALFFGPIACGKDGHGAMFCCGTNVVFRRAALHRGGRLPARLAHRGLRALDPPARARLAHVVRAGGADPRASGRRTWRRTSASSSAGRAAACRASRPRCGPSCRAAARAVPAVVDVLPHRLDRADLHGDADRPHPHRRAAAGRRGADQFLSHFAPYFGWSLLTVALVGGGQYTFSAYALQTASFWIHVQASVLTLLGRRGKFVVTPKTASRERQIRPVWPALVMIVLLARRPRCTASPRTSARRR